MCSLYRSAEGKACFGEVLGGRGRKECRVILLGFPEGTVKCWGGSSRNLCE